MPRTPEQIERDQKMVLQLAKDLSRGEKPGQTGPEGQKFLDFLQAMDVLGKQGMENEAKMKHALPANVERRNLANRSMTRGQLMTRMGSYKKSLLPKLRKLGASLQKEDYEQVKAQLPGILRDIDHFAFDYERYRKAFAGDLIYNDPVLQRFDELWNEGELPEGERLLNRVNELNVERDEEEKAGEGVDAEEKPIQINELIIDTQRKRQQLNTGRTFSEVYNPEVQSYEGVMGQCRDEAGTDAAEPEELLARALAAAALRKQGAPYSAERLQKKIDQIQESKAFKSLIQNDFFILSSLKKPEHFDRVLELYEQEQKGWAPSGPKSYESYLRLHTWPRVPPNKETEYLSKCIAASRLQEQGVPFDLEAIHEDAKQIQEQPAFHSLITVGSWAELGWQLQSRWLHRDEVAVAGHVLQAKRKSLLQANLQKDLPDRKSWAGYRRMHVGEMVPANASAADKRLCLAKALVAIRSMADDKPFNLKQARKAAKQLTKNRYFVAATRDINAVSEALRSGKLTKYFEDMANLRKQSLQARQPSQKLTEQKSLILNEESESASREEEPPKQAEL